jgi:hypothetical protein
VHLEVVAQLGGEFVDVLKDLVHASVLLEQFRCGHFADAGDAGDVVDLVAHEGLDVDREIGPVAAFFDHFGDVHHLVALDVVHADAVVKELTEILVLGDDENLEPERAQA